jgi:putative hemolysin
MIAALTRLLTLLALVLMPLGMTSAPAAASPMPAGHATPSANHCSEQGDEDEGETPDSRADCTAMCTALPATDCPTPAMVLQPKAPRSIGMANPFDGIILEIATPPPKLA